jgi:hypothetical protein
VGWINLLSTTPGAYSIIFDAESNAPGYGYEFFAMADRHLATEVYSTNNLRLVGNTIMETGRWYHGAMTYDGSNLNLYLDSILDGTLATSGPIDYTSTVNPRIGMRATETAHAFNGYLDELSLYNRALTADEIAWKYSCRPDTTPDPFAVAAQTGIYPGSTGSSAFVVTGINAPASISITSGFFGINSGACEQTSGTVVNGDSVQVSLGASQTPGQQTSTNVTVGGVSAAFSVTAKDYGIMRKSGADWYYHNTLQDAYTNAALSGDEIMAKASLPEGALDCNLSGKSVTIRGGFTDAFVQDKTLHTTITPNLIIRQGTVTVENIVVY